MVCVRGMILCDGICVPRGGSDSAIVCLCASCTISGPAVCECDGVSVCVSSRAVLCNFLVCIEDMMYVPVAVFVGQWDWIRIGVLLYVSRNVCGHAAVVCDSVTLCGCITMIVPAMLCDGGTVCV